MSLRAFFAEQSLVKQEVAHRTGARRKCRCAQGVILLDHIRDIRLISVVMIFAQPTVIAGIGGDAVKSKFGLGGIEFSEQAVEREDA